MSSFTVCVVLEDPKKSTQIETEAEEHTPQLISARVAQKLARKKSKRFTNLVAAAISSLGVTSMAVLSVYYRFSWQMEVGMEFWARWAHDALWHDSLSNMHEPHHGPREGPFELINDVFAIINAVTAIAFLSYGLFNKGFVPGLSFVAACFFQKNLKFNFDILLFTL